MQFDPTSLAKYGRLVLVARRLVEGFLTGVHKSPYKGSSVEFAEHRQYYPGDEIRHIDWRAVAKTDRYYVKEFEEETNLRTYLVVDASGSMAYTGAYMAKFTYAQHVAASLAYLLLSQRDAVGLALHDTQLRRLIRPKATSKQLLTILQALESARPYGETALAPLWHQIAEQLPRRGLVVLLSDGLGDVKEMLLALQRLVHHRHEVLFLHVLAPEELTFPFTKVTQFRNLEQISDRRIVDPSRLRKEYLANLESYLSELRQVCGKTQTDYHLLRTDEPVEKALGIFLSRRYRGR